MWDDDDDFNSYEQSLCDWCSGEGSEPNTGFDGDLDYLIDEIRNDKKKQKRKIVPFSRVRSIKNAPIVIKDVPHKSHEPVEWEDEARACEYYIRGKLFEDQKKLQMVCFEVGETEQNIIACLLDELDNYREHGQCDSSIETFIEELATYKVI